MIVARGFSSGGIDLLNIKVVTWSLAIWTTITFVFCVVYGMLTPSSVHMYEFLEQVLPGFERLSWQGFFVDLVQSFLYGAYADLVYVAHLQFSASSVDQAITLAK